VKLKEKVCIVMGGASGIGRAISTGFVHEGARVVVTDRDGPGAEATARMASPDGRSAIALVGDVTRDVDVQRVVDRCLHQFGRVDVLVNSAGIGRLGTVAELTEQQWDEVISVNLKGPFLFARRVLREMLNGGGGCVVNIASVTGIVPSPGRAAYCASKAGLIMLTKAMALDYAKAGIRVNAICPGVIISPMTEESLRNPMVRQEKLEKTPLGRLGMPEDIVPAAVYLASEESAFVTGHVMVVDGGWTIG
jgi:NAD(P)-dependent dehydrogenase (short-subunit alcohol dehydrogenase family)